MSLTEDARGYLDIEAKPHIRNANTPSITLKLERPSVSLQLVRESK